MIVARADVHEAERIADTVDWFCEVSGQRDGGESSTSPTVWFGRLVNSNQRSLEVPRHEGESRASQVSGSCYGWQTGSSPRIRRSYWTELPTVPLAGKSKPFHSREEWCSVKMTGTAHLSSGRSRTWRSVEKIFRKGGKEMVPMVGVRETFLSFAQAEN